MKGIEAHRENRSTHPPSPDLFKEITMTNTTCCNLTTNDQDLMGLEQRAKYDLADMIDNHVLCINTLETCPLENSEMGNSVHYHVGMIPDDGLMDNEEFEEEFKDTEGLQLVVLAEDISLTDD